MPFIPTEELQQKLLVDARTAGDAFVGVISGAKVVLFTNALVPSATTLLVDLTQPTYTGYAAKNATFAAPYRRPVGGFATESVLLIWQMGDADLPTTIYGYGITDGLVTPKLLGCELFPQIKSLNDTLDAIIFAAQIAIGGPNFGAAVYG